MTGVQTCALPISYPGISVQEMPCTDVFREACAASIEITPVPSTNPSGPQLIFFFKKKAYFCGINYKHIPLNPLDGVFFVAMKITGTTSADRPDAVAVKLTTAWFSPSFNWFQFGMLTNTRCSGAFGDMDPREVDTFSQVTLLKTVKVNGVGPPAPTTIYRS